MNTEQQIIENLRNVYDPEMPSVSVYDLGLIYELEVKDNNVKLVHTLTSPMCPFAEEICRDIYNAAKLNDDIELDISLTFEPMFTIEMVPEETRFAMGWF